MGVLARLLHKIELQTNLSILIWVGILNTVRKGFGNRLLRLFGHTTSVMETKPGLLAGTVELLRERLKNSFEEIEQKSQRLEESERQLRKSRDFLQTIIDSLDDELIVLDQQFCITRANRSMCLRHNSKEVVGRPCYEVTHDQNHPCSTRLCVCPVKKVWQTGRPCRVTHQHITSEGGISKKSYHEVSASPIFGSGGKMVGVVELMRDVTESKDMEKQILEANRQLLAVNAIATAMSQSLSLNGILNETLDKILDLIGAEGGVIVLFGKESQTLSYQVSRGLSEQLVDEIISLTLGEGIARSIMESGKPLVIEDTFLDSRVTYSVVIKEELRAFISLPLKSKERVIGVLNISSQEPRSFSKDEVQLLAAIGHQLEIAVENAQLYHELELKEQAQTELLQRIISAQEDERRRIARGLHDVTSQALATIAVRLEAFATSSGSMTEDAKKQLEAMKSLLATTYKEVHELIYYLRPSLIDDLGLLAALRSCAHNSLDAAGIEVHIEVVGTEKKLPSQIEIALFRIVQEAISNVLRHARAESTYISLEFKKKGVTVHVEDDGTGFDFSQEYDATIPNHGMGLLGMKERTELLQGTLSIKTRPGGGTKVEVEIPVDWEHNYSEDENIDSR